MKFACQWSLTRGDHSNEIENRFSPDLILGCQAEEEPQSQVD